MKFTININQKAIVDLGLQGKVDFIDLAIYDFITDFMLCDDCCKIQIVSVQYFWIKAELIIDNLPLLGITTTRGINKRIDKLVECDLLERCPDNQTLHQSFFKVGKLYNEYKFFTKNENSKGAWNENSKNYNSIPNTKDTDNKEKNKEKEINKELFEQCWIAYRRKGSKKKAFEIWCKLNDVERQNVLPHIKPYVASREMNYQKDFERYLRDKIFLDVVFKNNSVIYDPVRLKSVAYTPQGRSIWFDESTKSYWTDDNFYYGVISDGYTDEDRPDGATLTMSNARGIITWNSSTKKWEKR